MLQALALQQGPVVIMKYKQREQPAMTYNLTLQHKLTSEELDISIEQTDAFAAQQVAEQFYADYRVVRIENALDALLTANPDLTEGALGDF